jgi:lipopolysaccharide transport system permease protein
VATSDIASAGTLPGKRSAPPTTQRSRNRELLGELVRRDLKARYRGSNLGILWSLLNPLLYMIVYSIVFGLFLKQRIQNPGLGELPYPVFLLPGLLVFNFFSQGLAASVNSVLGNGGLVKKVAFPTVLLTLSAIIAAFVNFLISLALLVPILAFYHVHVGVALLAVPLAALVIFAFALGLGMLVAAGNVFFRDIEYLLTIALQVWIFMTPIIYQLEVVTQSHQGFAKWVLYANPLTWVVTSFQDTIAFNRWPQHWLGLGYSTLVSLVLVVLGTLLFRRMQGRFAEEL